MGLVDSAWRLQHRLEKTLKRRGMSDKCFYIFFICWMGLMVFIWNVQFADSLRDFGFILSGVVIMFVLFWHICDNF